MTTLTPTTTPKSLDTRNLLTLISVAILVGTELFGAAFAAGWALGGLFQLGDIVTHIFEGVFVLGAAVALYYFMSTAVSNEPAYH